MEWISRCINAVKSSLLAMRNSTVRMVATRGSRGLSRTPTCQTRIAIPVARLAWAGLHRERFPPAQLFCHVICGTHRNCRKGWAGIWELDLDMSAPPIMLDADIAGDCPVGWAWSVLSSGGIPSKSQHRRSSPLKSAVDRARPGPPGSAGDLGGVRSAAVPPSASPAVSPPRPQRPSSKQDDGAQ